MSRERPDGERRRRDQALSCSAVKAPTAAAATATSTSRPSDPLPLGIGAAAEFASGSACAAPPTRLRLVIATNPAVAIQTYCLRMSSSPAIVILYVTGAATASEMKAVTTSRPVIRMPDRSVVTFLAAACTGHYPGVRPGSLSAFSRRIPVIRR